MASPSRMVRVQFMEILLPYCVFHKELSVMNLPRILPDRQRTEPVLFGVFIHDDL